MKKYLVLLVFLFSTYANSQILVLEYSGDNTVDFHVYNSIDNSKNKIYSKLLNEVFTLKCVPTAYIKIWDFSYDYQCGEYLYEVKF
jgi:hypothetical protein